MDNKVIAILRHDAVQVPEWVAIVTYMIPVIDLQKLTAGRWADIILAHLVLFTLIDAINGRLAPSNSVDDVSSFYFDKHGFSPLS